MINYLFESRHVRALALMCLTLSTIPLSAQNGKERVTLKLKDATLDEFINEVENVSSYSFVFGEEVRKQDYSITVEATDMPLKDALEAAFANLPIKFRIMNKHILLERKPLQDEPKRKKHTISGYVYDYESSETLIGATVVDSWQRGTATNPYGFYSITLPDGDVSLNYSYIGYETRRKTLVLQRDTIINVRLKSNAQLQEVVVVSKNRDAGINATTMGTSEITMAQVKSMPAILGESDVMKTIQLMPGVQNGMEGSAGLHIRGGSPDQNLILLDGVPVYNVDHLLGFFSVFTPEAVKKVTLFKSSYPARFGGRLSSVIDVRTNDGDMKKFHGTFGIGLLSSRLQLEGPIVKDRTSFNISARRSYIDLLSKPIIASLSNEERFAYYFYDINAKINHKFSDKSRLFVNFYQGKDDAHYQTMYEEEVSKDDFKTNWGNTIASVRWNYIFNSKLFGNATIAYNKYKLLSKASTTYQDTKEQEKRFYAADYTSGIKDLSGKMDFEFNPNPVHHVKFGADYIHHNFHPEVATAKMSDNDIDTTFKSTSDSRLPAHEASTYIEDNYDLSSKLAVNAGVHLSLFNVSGKSYVSAQPRLSTRWALSNDFSLKASYTKMNQYVHLLTSMPISMPTDLWVPVTKNIRPMRAHQYSIGGYYSGLQGWDFSLEGYYKDMRNVLEYKDGANFFGSSTNWEEKVEMGRGRSYGLEFLAQKTVGKTTGWFSYTLSKSERKFAKSGISNGEWFPYKYDRRHKISLNISHKFSEKVDVGATWNFTSGNVMTLPMEYSVIITPDKSSHNGLIYNHYYSFEYDYLEKLMLPSQVQYQYHIEHRNNYRLPPTHTLNINANFHRKLRHGNRTISVSIYNVYNSMNPNFFYLGWSEEKKRNVLKKVTILPIIPSITYTYKF